MEHSSSPFFLKKDDNFPSSAYCDMNTELWWKGSCEDKMLFLLLYRVRILSQNADTNAKGGGGYNLLIC